MFSSKCKYAIRAVLFLAVAEAETKKISVKEISSELKIPFPFLGKILQDLAKKKILSSSKGPHGGFYLSEENLNSPIIRIIEVIDGLSVFNSCVLGLDKCSDKHPCPVHEEFKEGRIPIEKLFSNRTIREVSNQITTSNHFLVV